MVSSIISKEETFDALHRNSAEGRRWRLRRDRSRTPRLRFSGETRVEALKNIEEAIEVYLEDVRAAGESVPVEDESTFVEIALER